MYRVFDTTMAGASVGEKQSFWHDTVKSVMYELDMEFDDSAEFHGMVECCDLGGVQWIKVKSSPVSYRRHSRHCDGRAPQILVCVPLVGEVELDQLGRRTRCGPGQFTLEHSDSPYQFEYGAESDMWALRIPETMLQARARSPSRFCAMQFGAHGGVEKFFRDYLGAVAGNIGLESEAVRSILGIQITDLLAAALEGDSRVLQSTGSSIKNAHLARIEQYLRKNLRNPELSAEVVAAACGVSVRYLHLLFKDTGQTVARWILDHRLQLAYETLSRATAKLSISQLAYHHGFNDHAQFSSAFKKKYDCSPSDVLSQIQPKA